MTKRNTITVSMVLAAFTVIVLISFFATRQKTGEEEVVTDVAVHAGKITRKTLRRYITAYGTVEPEPSGKIRPAAGALLSAPISGILTEIHCIEGSQVEKGTVLFRLDTRLAEVAVAKSLKSLAFAEQTYERQKKLLASDGTSQKAFQEAEFQLNTARNELDAAKAELSLLEIKAPLNGNVVRINARIGQAVEPNAVLGEVIALDRLIVNARIPSREAILLKPGQPADFGVRDLAGELTIVGKDIDPGTDTVLAQVSVPAKSGLQPGQFVMIRIVSEEHPNVLVVPEESVVFGPDGGKVLFLVENDKAVPRPVKSGLSEGGLTEIEGEGLKEGQVIVTTDAYNITGETKVHIVENDKN
jgi:membrane fusion protein (multidrug efflux system)